MTAILAGIAIPGFVDWLPDYSLNRAARDLFASFQLARITAVRTGANCAITFHQPVDGTTYDYVVFRDTDNDLEFDSSESQGIIKKVQWPEYVGVSDSGNTFPDNDDGLPAIAFRPNSIPVDNTGAFGSGALTLINSNSKEAGVQVSAAGNIRIN